MNLKAYEWTKLLTSWSKDILSSKYRSYFPANVIASGWLGYPGASEAQIAQAETRLNTKLSPSYREFLKITNGWRMTTPFIDKLWSTEEIEWFSARHQDWIDGWTEGVHYYGQEEPLPDQEYFVYGEGQVPLVREEHLRATLEISDEGDSSIYLLNPLVISDGGE